MVPPAVLPGEAFKWVPGIPPRAQGAVCSSPEFTSFFGLATGHVAGGRPSTHCRRLLHHRGGAWLVHDRGVRDGARSGMLRWQLAAQLVATLVTPQSVAIRTSAGVGVAAIFLRGAAPARLVTRDVSPRLGQRVAAVCLELQLDASLEALTIIVPASRDGSLITFEVDETDRSICWVDAAGRHRVSCAAPGQSARLSAGIVENADLVWWAEVAAAGDVSALLAAMPTFTLPVPHGEQVVTEGPGQSGRMIAFANSGGRWMRLDLEEPRCG